ncbi:MAG: hypothetical protein BRD50_08505, partial [Bacteroidetes bacterium SW_11_45_7]
KLAYVYDEPIADISIIPTYAVSELASGHVKAVLSGEGADDLFAGYTWQYDYMQKMADRTWQQKLAQKLGWPEPLDTIEFYAEAMAMGRFDTQELRKILHPHMQASIPDDSEWFYREHGRTELSPLKSIQNMDVQCFMGELVLTKIDRASMANSLEVRVPYLDHELFETLMQVRESCYFQFEQQKVILKNLIEDVMPQEILDRSKQGFVGPDSYYQEMGWYRDELLDGHLIRDSIITGEGVQQYLQNADHWRLWKLLILEKWYREWM